MLAVQSVTEHRGVNSLSFQRQQLHKEIVMFINCNQELQGNWKL